MNLLFASVALLMAADSVTTISDFTYYEKTDPISDNLMAGVLAQNEQASLIIGCDHDRGKDIYVILETRRFLTRTVMDHNPRSTGNAVADLATIFNTITGDTFQYRVEKGESHNARSEYTGIQTASVKERDARAFAERLVEGQSVFIRVSGANGYIDVRYDINGIQPLLERVADKCGDKRLLKRLSRRR